MRSVFGLRYVDSFCLKLSLFQKQRFSSVLLLMNFTVPLVLIFCTDVRLLMLLTLEQTNADPSTYFWPSVRLLSANRNAAVKCACAVRTAVWSL